MLANGCIIGGGIAGLSTAIAMKKIGISLPVYEAASEFKPVGAGIILSINAMRVFKHLDLLTQIVEKGVQLNKMVITNRMLEQLSTNIIADFNRKFSLPVVSIDRPSLLKILLKKYDDTVHFGKKLSGIENPGSRLKVEFSDGETIESAYAICADGIRSRSRQLLFPQVKLRDQNQMCWRGMVDFELPGMFRGGLFEAWGKGVRFGFTEVSEDRVYWYALANKNKVLDEGSGLLEHFKDFHPMVNNLLEATDITSIHFDEIHDCPPMENWNRGKACLIGDAAHATTPNLGQGAAQALEDAYCLSRLFFEKSDYGPELIFSLFQQKRKVRADHVVEMSRSIGKIAHVESDWLCGFRNFAMKKSPRFFVRSQMEKLVNS